MQEIYRVIARLTQTDLTVMIMGESGTGKELVARALHDYGKRTHGTFVAVNMAAIPKELVESELFGHERGAFTGATNRGIGRFEQAEGGTLFLDEIGDMPLEAQTRLLRVLQQGEYTTVGGRMPIKTDVRIIAATNRDLRQLIQQGLFREDLVLPPECRAAAPAAACASASRTFPIWCAISCARRKTRACPPSGWTTRRSICCKPLSLAGQCARTGKSDPPPGGAAFRRHDPGRDGRRRTERAARKLSEPRRARAHRSARRWSVI